MTYALYHSRKHLKLEISTWKNHCEVEELTFWNNNYFLANNRAELRKLGLEIKQEWLNEIKYELKKIENLKIKTKY